MVVKSTKQTLNKILGLLKKNQSFTFQRYGDSQLLSMETWQGQDWEQTVTPKLRELQIKSIGVDDPDYLIAPSCGYKLEPGMDKGTFALYRNDKDFVKTVEKYAITDEFWHCEALHYGMLYHQKLVKQIFDEINKCTRLLIVAGEDLNVLKYFPAPWISIPMSNAFKDWEKILDKIYSHYPDMVLLSCGMTSQVLQYFMFLDNPNITTINMGSVFNALLEITEKPHTRAWIHRNIDKIKEFKKLL